MSNRDRAAPQMLTDHKVIWQQLTPARAVCDVDRGARGEAETKSGSQVEVSIRQAMLRPRGNRCEPVGCSGLSQTKQMRRETRGTVN